MLVPHDPDDDPRIRWVSSTCSELARTHVIGAVWNDIRPAVEYDGTVLTERRNLYDVSSTRARAAYTAFGGGILGGSAARYLEREGQRPAGGVLRQLDHRAGAVAGFSRLRPTGTSWSTRSRALGVRCPYRRKSSSATTSTRCSPHRCSRSASAASSYTTATSSGRRRIS